MKRVTKAQWLILAGIALFSAACLFPMLTVLSASVSDEKQLLLQGYSILPRGFTLDAYRMILRKSGQFLQSYKITLIVTIVGTLLAVIITGMAGYTLSNKRVQCRQGLAMYFFITMVFSAGIVPWYILCNQLGLRNNFAALIVPSLMFNPFNMFLVRNHMATLPDALAESAYLDGANDAVIAFRIVFPLSTPVLATIALFYGLGYWNDWWNAIMLVEDSSLYPVQYLLFKIQSEAQMLNEVRSASISATGTKLPSETVKMATVVITIGPIVLLFPYLQRYFVCGLTVGAIKG